MTAPLSARARLRATVLGCGSSAGVPRIGGGVGGDWGACDPSEPKNRRRRASLLIEAISDEAIAGEVSTTIVVDTSPDFRAQMIDAGVTRLDGVVYTHGHADHTHGIDDLRAFFLATRRRVTCHADADTARRLQIAFGYIFGAVSTGYPPIAVINVIADDAPVSIAGPGGDLAVMPVSVVHGHETALALRIGGLVYAPDISDLSEAAAERLSDADVLILDALRPQPHPSHLSFDQALDLSRRLRARRTVLTHMTGDLDYAATQQRCPAGMEPAFDGMQIELGLAP